MKWWQLLRRLLRELAGLRQDIGRLADATEWLAARSGGGFASRYRAGAEITGDVFAPTDGELAEAERLERLYLQEHGQEPPAEFDLATLRTELDLKT